ncbi:hypothetical protein I4U23_029285 [Adineta vaga]|nr:hypothetical protein I4U23_029285 [Adineta vaga]
MRLVYLLVLIALLAVTFTDAFQHTPLSSVDTHSLSNVVNARVVRREEYDPYGFNSILSRYYKRSKFYGTRSNENYSPDELSFIK